MTTHALDDLHGGGRATRLVVLMCMIALVLLVGGCAAIVIQGRYADYKAPGADTLPLPAGVAVISERSECGSGGCPLRELTIARTGDAGTPDDVMDAVIVELLAHGWTEEAGGAPLGTTLRSPSGEVRAGVSAARSTEPRAGTTDGTAPAPVTVWLGYTDLGVGRWE
jgi:hypothetical protein